MVLNKTKRERDHKQTGSSSDPSINGHLHYPHDLDRPLNETDVDKIRQYHTDYNNRPSHVIAFMSDISSTSGHLHCEIVRLLFLQDHRETDRFLSVSGVHLAPSHFHFLHTVFSEQGKKRSNLSKRHELKKSTDQFQLLVFHCTDTHLYVFSLALVLPVVHNKPFTFTDRRSTHRSSLRLTTSSPRLKDCGLTST